MTSYPASQVLTIKELRNGEAMHCGMTAGKCMVWTVVDKDTAFAYVRVGSSIVKMTGRDIRSGLPMYRATDCPICSLTKDIQISQPESRESVAFTQQVLESADVSSALSNVENVRMKNTTGQGGAAMTSRRKYVEARTAAIIQQLMQGTKN